MRSRYIQLVLLVSALLPSILVLILLLLSVLRGTIEVDWHKTIWSPAVIQIASIVAFWIHAARNRRLTSDEVTGWVLLFISLIPFAQVRYWTRYIWNADET